MLGLTSEEGTVGRTKKEIADIEKALVDFKQKKPLAEKALSEKVGFNFGDTLYYLGLKENKELIESIYSSDFTSRTNDAKERVQQFKATLENAIPHAEAKLAFLRKRLLEEETQLATARKTLHQEDQRQADLAVYKQGELNKIQLEKLKQEQEHAEREQERRTARLEQLSNLGSRSEDLRRELESDWQQRRAEQDSERESLYQFIFNQNNKS